ncbi:MAG: TonB-dependent receptor [Pseudomonadota bacterium]
MKFQTRFSHTPTFAGILLSGLFVQPLAAETVSLEPITVEARYWEEDPNRVPTSASLIDNLSDDPGADVELIQQATPNVTIENSSVQTRINIRGVSGLDSGLQDPVGFFVNGVALPLGGNQLPDMSIFNSVEIVKGPQGALYGRNTEAGAIKFNSIDPSWELTGHASISTMTIDSGEGSADGYVFSASGANELVDDRLAGAIEIQIDDNDGPFYNELTDSRQGGEVDRSSLAASALFVAGANTDIIFKTVIDDHDSGRNRFRFESGVNQTDPFVTNADTEGFDNEKTAVHAVELTHGFDKFELTSITGVTDYEREFEIDLDATPAPLPATLYDLQNDSFSQEFRLSSEDANPDLNWLAGVYFFDEDSDIDFTISPMFNTTNRVTEIEQNGQALFGQIEYSFNPRWSVTIGGRYEQVDQSASQSFSNAMLNTQYDADLDSDEFLPTASLGFLADEQNFVYVSYSEGYLPGGYNYNSAGDADSFTFDEEHSELIELGWKNTALQNKLSTAISVFQITTTDKQIVDLLPGFIQSVSNAGETESTGAEFSIAYSVSPLLSTYFNLGILQTEATSFVSNTFGMPLDLSGNDLPYAPERTYSAGVRYESDNGIFGHLSVRGSDDYFFDSQNLLEQSSFDVVDFELGYQFKNARLTLWAKNVTEEEIVSRAVSTPNGVVVEDTLPRTIGLTFSAEL